MLYFLVYLLALPFAVWFTATVCALIDEPNPLKPLLRVVVSICVVLVVLLLTNRDLWMPILLAWLTVIVLHVLGFWWVSRRSIGVTIYENQPPPPPVLEDEE